MPRNKKNKNRTAQKAPTTDATPATETADNSIANIDIKPDLPIIAEAKPVEAIPIVNTPEPTDPNLNKDEATNTLSKSQKKKKNKNKNKANKSDDTETIDNNKVNVSAEEPLVQKDVTIQTLASGDAAKTEIENKLPNIPQNKQLNEEATDTTAKAGKKNKKNKNKNKQSEENKPDIENKLTSPDKEPANQKPVIEQAKSTEIAPAITGLPKTELVTEDLSKKDITPDDKQDKPKKEAKQKPLKNESKHIDHVDKPAKSTEISPAINEPPKTELVQVDHTKKEVSDDKQEKPKKEAKQKQVKPDSEHTEHASDKAIDKLEISSSATEQKQNITNAIQKNKKQDGTINHDTKKDETKPNIETIKADKNAANIKTSDEKIQSQQQNSKKVNVTTQNTEIKVIGNDETKSGKDKIEIIDNKTIQPKKLTEKLNKNENDLKEIFQQTLSNAKLNPDTFGGGIDKGVEDGGNKISDIVSGDKLKGMQDKSECVKQKEFNQDKRQLPAKDNKLKSTKTANKINKTDDANKTTDGNLVSDVSAQQLINIDDTPILDTDGVDKKTAGVVKDPLSSLLVEPEHVCPNTSKINQGPDIESIWKILDPPKEPVNDVMKDDKPESSLSSDKVTKLTTKNTEPEYKKPIVEDKSKIIPGDLANTPSISVKTDKAISDTQFKPESKKPHDEEPITKVVSVTEQIQKDSPKTIEKDKDTTILDANLKLESKIQKDLPKTIEKDKNTTILDAKLKPESKIPLEKSIEKVASIVELPKEDLKIVDPIAPLVTPSVVSTTTIVAEQLTKNILTATQIEPVCQAANVKNEASPQKKEKLDKLIDSSNESSPASTSPSVQTSIEPKIDNSAIKVKEPTTTKVTKAKTATTKDKPTKEPKVKKSETAKDPADKSAPKEAKPKITKSKTKAPAPPAKDGPTESTPTSSADQKPTTEQSATESAPPAPANDPAKPAPTVSKNAAGSDSVQSVDVTAVLGSTAAESLHAVTSHDVSITADVFLRNDMNATFTIPTKGAKLKSTAADPKKAPIGEPSSASADSTGSAQLLDLLQSKPDGKESVGIKPGAVAGNVRTKAPAKTVPKPSGTGTVPKSNEAVTKPKQGTPPPLESAPKTAPSGKGKQPSPTKDSPPSANKPNTANRNAKTPPRNAAAAATKSRNSPQKEKFPPNVGQRSAAKPTIQPRPLNTKPNATGGPVSSFNRSGSSASSNASNSKSPSPNPPYDDEEYVEFKFSPRPVFMSTICQVCKIPLPSHVHCKLCLMVSYCSVEHLQEDAAGHRPLCVAIQEIAKKRGGHVYNNARILNDDDYRSLRVHTLNLCENALQRHLQPFEREILLFPRLCATGTCREWRQQLLTECKSCGQVSYCAEHANHLPASHSRWCQSFALYQKLVYTQKKFGRIEPSLPSKIINKPYQLPVTIDETFKSLYKNYGAIKDDCTYAALTQLATAPLTAFYGLQRTELAAPIGESFTIHLVGAELQFEADTLDKWETFFLHLVPQLVELRVTFVGPELNAENLPLEILSRIRMCRTCRQNCRAVKFDFQCGQLYHNYASGSAFTKPDLICFFNPGLYRATGFNGVDTWPDTIRVAAAQNVPIIVTSYTEVESPRDLDRLQREAAKADLALVLAPHVNPFASQRPERNFISDEVAPMIFKNYYCFVCK